MMTQTKNTALLAGISALCWLSTIGGAAGQTLPQLDNGIRNVFSEDGAPVDPEPPGPTERTGTQFSSGTAFGGWQSTRIKDSGGTVVAGSTSEAEGAVGTFLLPAYRPLAGNGSPIPSQTIQLKSVKMSRPMVLRTVSYSLGSEIPRPGRKPDGTPLDPNVFAEAEFYFKEPTNAATGNFYWSPHAEKVFASRPGVITIDWEERVSGNIFSQKYTISGSPAKPAKTIYWSERGFKGPVVNVPSARVSDVNVIYNPAFPESVAVGQDYQTLNDPPVDPNNALPPERRTLYYDTIDGSIHAYNIEGRVLVELLGDLREPERLYREHLGLEIVDVVKEVRPDELRVAIGERILADNEAGISPEDEDLVPSVVAGLSLNTDPYVYEHLSLGGTKRTLYAIKETTPLRLFDLNDDGLINELDEQQSNEVLIYWKEEGLMQLLWPKKYVGYIFKWPEEYLAGEASEYELREFYSMYARPEDPNDSAATGVRLNSADNPVLVYQDDETRQHAHITPQNVFYTTPGTGSRSLIRYTNGDAIWFERVYSQPNTDFELSNLPAIPATVGERILPLVSQQTANWPARLERSLMVDFGGGRGSYSGVSSPPHAFGILPLTTTNWNLVTGDDSTLEFADGEVATGVSIDTGSQIGRTGPVDWDASVVATSNGSDATGVFDTGLTSDYIRGPTFSDSTAVRILGLSPGEYDVYVLLRFSGLNRVGIGVDSDDVSTFDLLNETADPEFQIHSPIATIRNDIWEEGSNYLIARVEITSPNDRLVVNFLGNQVGMLIVPAAYEEELLPIAASGDVNGFVGYVRQTRGDAFNPTAYADPFSEGFPAAAQGAIIPVNALPGNDALEVWWYQKSQPGSDSFASTYWPSYVQRYQLQWPVTDPDDANLNDEIVMARNDGSGDLGIAANGTIYRQPDPDLPGYNPNEEHALMSGGVAWALRDDLNLPTSSEPFVLVDYTAEDGRPAMVTRRVLRENLTHTFTYEAPVGVILEAPMPVRFMPLPIDETGEVANTEVLGAPTNPAAFNEGNDYYDHFTYTDRKGSSWIYRGPHQQGVNVGSVNDPSLNFKMHYYYMTEEAFDFPGLTAPDVGTIIPYLSDGPVSDPIADVTPAEVAFIPVWPDTPAVLNVAETLGLPKNDLPAVRGQISARLLYEQSVANENVRSAKLHDPTRAKVYEFGQTQLDAMGSINTSDYLGKTYFPALPPHLSERLFYDPNIGTLGALVFIGEFVDAPLGEAYYLLNVMSPKDVVDAKGLVSAGNSDWNEAVDGLSTTLETFVEKPAIPGTYIVGSSEVVGATELAEVNDDDIAVDSYAINASGGGTGYVVMITGDGEAFTPEDGVISMNVFKVEAPLYTGELKVIESANPLDEKLTLRHSGDFAGDPDDYEFEWVRAQPVDGSAPESEPGGSGWILEPTNAPLHTIEGANITTLTDNYFAMRYKAIPGKPAHTATNGDWSPWTTPNLAEGWIKRALGGINPFEQRITDLFNNSINTDVSLLTQAGGRWEGNIALNLENIDDFGLIEIYETILNRGKDLSIHGAPPLNVPAANDALLLAAGYLSDLYMLVGNEAFADAANPTIAFDTEGGDFGEFNTALFAFKGQLASVLDEELALLRGRDDSLQPGVEVAPVYNRLVWNFTGGINSGEPVYSLNYNILDNNVDGAADATDAAIQYPQGHGDAYGHYLSAIKGYYSLLNSGHFAWTPRIEAVSVLGQPVSIDYQDERKFATAAAAIARTASQTLDLTYRKEFTADENAGWEHLTDENSERAWGTDEWATRAGLGTYVHWVTANSILPEEDTNPSHEGIEIVDRTTVPELDEVVANAEAIQQTLENADNRLNPLGLSKGALSFDISPDEIDQGKTHYEQVFDRAIAAMKNAVFAFDNAKRSTAFLRQQENSVAGQRAAIEAQEQAFENELIEIYGTPYPSDIGPGKTYAQGYAGPDLLHFGYVETPELFFDPTLVSENYELFLDPQFVSANSTTLNYGDAVYIQINEMGDVVKPEAWTGRRAHPGRLQTSISDLLAARQRVRQTLESYTAITEEMTALLSLYQARLAGRSELLNFGNDARSSIEELEATIRSAKVIIEQTKTTIASILNAADAVQEALPLSAGLTGGDLTSVARGAIKGASAAATGVSAVTEIIEFGRQLGLIDEVKDLEQELAERTEEIAWERENAQLIANLQSALGGFLDRRTAIDVALRQLDQATRDLQATKAQGNAIQSERLTFRKRASAIVQGYRTRDLAFRVFRDEALEKYKTLFDLSARYTFLAARAYDYETGLLDASGSSAAAAFYDGIVQSRALGVVADGVPQFTASTTGDPGLAGVLAQMQGDWAVAKTRLGFNNPDRYRTTFSLRGEHFRIIPGENGDSAWKDKLSSFAKGDLLEDPDVRRYCMQIATENNLPVPGLVIPFQTTITRGFNFFGQPSAAGDHDFSPSSFATKIRASGIAFDGYIGMDDPTSIGGAVGGAGGESPDDPDLGFLDPNGLKATPYIYLIPAGVDSMRSPPLGDTSRVRTWSVDDQAIPLPFNIGNSDFSTNNSFISADSLSEDPFAIRKHQAFRAVPSGTVFSSAPGFTNSRLIGRSVWNSQWKIVIPGDTLLNNPDVGIEIFLDTVKDIELFLETYSYSGN